MYLGPLRRVWSVLVSLGICALAAGFILPAPFAVAQQATAPATFPMTVTANRVPGASGQVTITPMGNNQIRVEIAISGLPPTPSSRAAHIHTAQGAVCDNGAPVTYPLNDVMVDSSGHGSSTTTVTLTADKPVLANNAYVNVHEQSSPPGQGVICANITQSYTASGGAGAAPTSGATSSTAAASGVAGNCAPFDSWCAYCSSAPAAAACVAFTPAHAVGTTAAGATAPSGAPPVAGVDAGLAPGSLPLPVPGSVMPYGP